MRWRERDRETMDTMDEWKGVKWIEIKTEREREVDQMSLLETPLCSVLSCDGSVGPFESPRYIC